MKKRNDKSRERHLALKNGSDDFIRIAKEVESRTDFRWSSGMGDENYYGVDGLAYTHYEDAIYSTAEKMGIK